MRNGLGSYGVGVARFANALQAPELVQTANYRVWPPGVPRSLAGCPACMGADLGPAAAPATAGITTLVVLGLGLWLLTKLG